MSTRVYAHYQRPSFLGLPDRHAALLQVGDVLLVAHLLPHAPEPVIDLLGREPDVRRQLLLGLGGTRIPVSSPVSSSAHEHWRRISMTNLGVDEGPGHVA